MLLTRAKAKQIICEIQKGLDYYENASYRDVGTIVAERIMREGFFVDELEDDDLDEILTVALQLEIPMADNNAKEMKDDLMAKIEAFEKKVAGKK